MNGSMSRRALLAGALPLSLGCGRPSREYAASFWYSYGGKNREVLERMLRAFNDAYPNARIEATFQGDYFEALAKLRTALAARAAPALSHVVGEVLPYLVNANVLEPLDDYPGASALDLEPKLAQAGSFAAPATARLFAIPFNRSTPIMYVNQDMLAGERLPVPRTWSELREAARALTVAKAGEVSRWGLETPVASWFWAAMVFSAGGQLTGRDGEFTLGGDAGVRALSLWQTLVHEDHAMRPPIGRDYNAWQAGMQDFLAERTAMLWSSSAFLRYVEENARFAVRAAPLPFEQSPALPTGGTFFVILRNAEPAAKQAAWSFVRWMTEPMQTAAWSETTGYLPVHRLAVSQMRERARGGQHPNDMVMLDQLASVTPWPWSPNLFQVQREVLDPLLEDAVLQGRAAAAVIDEARAAANSG